MCLTHLVHQSEERPRLFSFGMLDVLNEESKHLVRCQLQSLLIQASEMNVLSVDVQYAERINKTQEVMYNARAIVTSPMRVN